MNKKNITVLFGGQSSDHGVSCKSAKTVIDGISTEFRLVGDFRLARYATFLLQDYFPLHDDLCYEEGRAMKDYACGIEGAKETLEFISGRIKKQREK